MLDSVSRRRARSLWPLASGLAWCVLLGCSRGARPDVEAERVEATARAASLPGAPSAPVAAAEAVSVVPVGASPPVAVVELFTSEGCSSCPPADRVLARLAEQAERENHAVFVLSFHVDYWNYLGWKDRFSRADYSERQRRYGALNPGSGTYTPQIVINGQTECVGSSAFTVQSLVAAALERAPATAITLTKSVSEAGIRLDYRVSGAVRGRVLNLALLEPHAESAVQSGENRGERLLHVNVVRDFTSRPLAAASSGHWLIAPRADFDIRHATVVAFAEGETQRDVSGASAISLQ